MLLCIIGIRVCLDVSVLGTEVERRSGTPFPHVDVTR